MRRRMLLSLAGVVVVALVAGAYFIGRSTSSSEVKKSLTSTSASASSSLPVVECPSSFGAGSVPPSQYPAEEAVKLPVDQEDRLAFYSDSTRSTVPLLAPRGWKCIFDEGADGSMFISIYPSDQNPPISIHSSQGSKSEGVNASSTSDCQGCAATLTCPVFINAPKDLGYTSLQCPSTAPPEEKLKFLEGSPTGSYGIVNIYDPPDVEGTNDGSGGQYPANGVLELLPYQSNWTSTAESCVLPSKDKSLCSAITTNFVADEWWN